MTSSLAGIDCPQALQAPLFPNNLKQRMMVGTDEQPQTKEKERKIPQRLPFSLEHI
jgi:hypothetical protein